MEVMGRRGRDGGGEMEGRWRGDGGGAGERGLIFRKGGYDEGFSGGREVDEREGG